MKIVINFDSSWANGFIEGEDCLSKKGKPEIRPFFATSKSKNATDKPLTKNTILGVLCRLIGDQRKLYDAKNQGDYYFRDCEDLITYEVESCMKYNETAIITNKNPKDSRCAPTTYLGVLPDETQLFYSEFSHNLWSVLELSLAEVCDYIVDESLTFDPRGVASLNCILNRVSDLTNKDLNPQFEMPERITENYDKKIAKEDEKRISLDIDVKGYDKKLENITLRINKLADAKIKEISSTSLLAKKITRAAEKIKNHFDGINIIDNYSVYPIKLYGAALYLTAHKLKDKGLINFLSDKNKLPGFAETSFSFNGNRDFLNTLAGGRKKTVRTPANIEKNTGKLVIKLREPIDLEDLYQRIENARVSSFYLGKKGLAYVSDIRI